MTQFASLLRKFAARMKSQYTLRPVYGASARCQSLISRSLRLYSFGLATASTNSNAEQPVTSVVHWVLQSILKFHWWSFSFHLSTFHSIPFLLSADFVSNPSYFYVYASFGTCGSFLILIGIISRFVFDAIASFSGLHLPSILTAS